MATKTSVYVTQPNKELVPATSRKEKLAHLNKSLETDLDELGLFNDMQRDAFPVRCSPEALLEVGVSTI